MSSFSYSSGCGAVLSLRNVDLTSTLNDKQRLPMLLRSKEIASLDSFDSDIDRIVKLTFDTVLKEIADFFLSPAAKHEDVFDVRRVSRKLKTAVVQCSVADVSRLMDGVLAGLHREIGEYVVIRSGHADIYDVVYKFQCCGGKKKQLLFIEQAESLSPQFLNGLFYSLASLQCDIIVLLCVSTKQIMFTSRVSRRCLDLLNMKRFSFSLSPEVFHSLVSNVLLNPSFTDLRLQPTFMRFLRSSFFGDVFSISFLKKCIRFALYHRLWISRSPDPSNDVCRRFVDTVNKYMGVLEFLHTNLYTSCDFNNGSEEQRISNLLKLHEDIQLGGFMEKISNSPRYRDWTQSLARLSEEDIYKMLDHEGISSFDLKLHVINQDVMTDDLEPERLKLASSTSLCEKTSVLQLKNKMREIVSSRRRNPQTMARQKLICDIEKVFRSVLRPFTSISDSEYFLFGDRAMHLLAPKITTEIERTLLVSPDEQQPLNVAVRTLFEQGRWKTIPLDEWAKSFFADMMKQESLANKEQLKSIFFACVGQLEHMGIIRATTNAKVPSVTVIYHMLDFTV